MAAVGENLSSLKNAKAWIQQAGSQNQTTDDQLIGRLITAASRFILGQLERPTLRLRTYTLQLDGSGSNRLSLPYFPVIDVSSLADGTFTVPPCPDVSSPGFLLEAWDGYPPGRMQQLIWRGGCFSRCVMGVAVTFRSGYLQASEPQSAAPKVTVDEPLGEWLADEGVTMNGVAMTAVSGTPATGQYKLGVEQGVYEFAPVDQGNLVLISYSFVPADLAQACRELVAERYSYRTRVGQTNKSIDGTTTVGFSLKDMPDYVATSLQPYKRVVF